VPGKGRSSLTYIQGVGSETQLESLGRSKGGNQLGGKREKRTKEGDTKGGKRTRDRNLYLYLRFSVFESCAMKSGLQPRVRKIKVPCSKRPRRRPSGLGDQEIQSSTTGTSWRGPDELS